MDFQSIQARNDGVEAEDLVIPMNIMESNKMNHLMKAVSTLN